MAHVVSDSLIKSVQPGIELHLLDGKYTPRNRPIQDLVTFHEIGVKEFGLNWAALLADLAATALFNRCSGTQVMADNRVERGAAREYGRRTTADAH